jgi:hypothetical protein
VDALADGAGALTVAVLADGDALALIPGLRSVTALWPAPLSLMLSSVMTTAQIWLGRNGQGLPASS